ncbi:MAG: hypothetical protein C4523_10970 [Myxococcales bacterium]|nr:MAG: hypothetical protein C4523_10970 [Myxococcales bacterium]
MSKRARIAIQIFSALAILAAPQLAVCLLHYSGLSSVLEAEFGYFQQAAVPISALLGKDASPQADPLSRETHHFNNASFKRRIEYGLGLNPISARPPIFEHPSLRFLPVKRHLFSREENDSKPPSDLFAMR